MYPRKRMTSSATNEIENEYMFTKRYNPVTVMSITAGDVRIDLWMRTPEWGVFLLTGFNYATLHVHVHYVHAIGGAYLH